MTDLKNNKIECPRCGGSGETEFTHVVYGVCFMCKGSGMTSPTRVEELTEKAKLRKEKKSAKIQAEREAQEQAQLEREEAYYKWQKSRNVVYFNKMINKPYTDAESNKIKTIKGLVDVLKYNKETPKEDVIKMFEDYFKEECFYFRYAVSKYTLDTFGFILMDIPSDYDLKEKCEIAHVFKEDIK